ncbi:hypothetical protein SLEP1_g14404 [Rubroshorea leprosula]|uniref:Uncharacterized protein n=1 Tax=Rubroshorea leprosula TaxID=152421 RepID=A0AAV5ITD6_9ROSI|nr:hypothetical protein SLEP1_g14404 [Rubroshorea leprosula]
MVRAPCCEKMGLKKGPWTPEEDQILIKYIQLHGHSNWRALPKQAGLLRCGKSCRLRWINYLRPDIKRGNFTEEEEETIIKLHEMLGNRWSAIAARLPGRTDNEIKNVWHTHLKKRLIKRNQPVINSPSQVLLPTPDSAKGPCRNVVVSSPQRSTSDDMDSTVTTSENNGNNMSMKYDDLEGNFTEIDESFWSEVLSADNSEVAKGKEYEMVGGGGGEAGIPLAVLERVNDGYGLNLDDNNVDFWYNLFTRAGEILPELPDNI